MRERKVREVNQVEEYLARFRKVREEIEESWSQLREEEQDFLCARAKCLMDKLSDLCRSIRSREWLHRINEETSWYIGWWLSLEYERMRQSGKIED